MTCITGKTRLVALLGSPVSHSRSPRMQNACFQAAGVDLVYLAFDVQLDRLQQAVQALRLLDVRGANVTMPLKREICRYLDRLSPSAQLAGAVNTILNEDGVLTGHITDGEGYLMSLADEGVDYVGKAITIVGAGGAGTAVAIEASATGVRSICLFNAKDAFYDRGEATVAMLRSRFGCDAAMFDLADREALRLAMSASDIFVNGTPVGMEATDAQSVITDTSFFHPGLVVSDLIYVPAETRLLEMARSVGCRTVGGLGMQLFQGVRAFQLWTGKDMPLDVARAALFGASGRDPLVRARVSPHS